jgi:magnesium chelatase subunit D
LLDRFGLHVEITTEADTERRVGIVELRDAYDRDPHAFSLRFADEQKQLASKIVRAGRNLNKVKIDRSLLTKAATICVDLGIEGHRGELTLVRAARALAAFEGRLKVIDEDLRRVAPMALRHRLPRNAFEDAAATERIDDALRNVVSNSTARTKEQSEVRPVDNGKERSGSRTPASDNGSSTAAEFPAPTAKTATRIDLKSPSIKRSGSVIEKRSSGKKKRVTSEIGGRHVRSINVATTTRKIALAATVRALVANAAVAAQHSSTVSGQRDLNRFQEALRYKLFSRKHGSLFIFVIDTSGSMARHRIALAKRSILDMLKQSYLNRDSVAIVTFRGAAASLDLPPSRSILRARRAIDSLIVGGSTPLSAGLLRASEVMHGVAADKLEKWVIVFTDGRANVPLQSATGDDRGKIISEEVRQLGVLLRRSGANIVIANTQRHFERNDDPKRLALLLEAQLVSVFDTL